MADLKRRVRIPLRGVQCEVEFITFDGFSDGLEHFAIAFVGQSFGKPPLVRIHSECLTGDVFGSLRCDCGPQLREAIQALATSGGYLIYLRQEGRGIGFNAKIDAYELQDRGLDTFEANRRLGHPADARSFHVAAEILSALSISSIRLITNNPVKVRDVASAGIEVVEIVPTSVHVTSENARYLQSKIDMAGHMMSLIKVGRT